MSNIPANFTDGVFTITDDNSLSATLLMSNGDQALSGLVTYGRAQVVTESRGAVVGLRKGARAFPTIRSRPCTVFNTWSASLTVSENALSVMSTLASQWFICHAMSAASKRVLRVFSTALSAGTA